MTVRNNEANNENMLTIFIKLKNKWLVHQCVLGLTLLT